MTDQPYDPYIPSGSGAGGSHSYSGNSRTAALQAVGDPSTWPL